MKYLLIECEDDNGFTLVGKFDMFKEAQNVLKINFIKRLSQIDTLYVADSEWGYNDDEAWVTECSNCWRERIFEV